MKLKLEQAVVMEPEFRPCAFCWNLAALQIRFLNPNRQNGVSSLCLCRGCADLLLEGENERERELARWSEEER